MSDEPDAEYFSGRRWKRIWAGWLANIPPLFKQYVKHLEDAASAERGRLSQANLRASMAERRERDAAREIAVLKRRVAELESRP